MIFEATAIMAGLGIFFGLVLSYFSKKFELKVDPRIKEISEILPHVNCGACGYANCEEFAKAVIAGESPPDSCKVGREKVAEKIKAVLEKYKQQE